MYAFRITTLTLASLLLLAPAAAADHDDPLHGTVPHSVATDPSKIVPVNVSTPHPYAFGTVYEYAITVEGAASVAVHFERYDVNGFRSWLTGECIGSRLVILDAHDGGELDALCGAQDADFWTPSYRTDRLVLRLETDGFHGAHHGFDVYEVAVDDARVLASVPYSHEPTVRARPDVEATADPADPGAGTTADVELSALWGPHGASTAWNVNAGRWVQCGFAGCAEEEGAGASFVAEAGGAGTRMGADGVAYAIHTGDGPLDWWIPVPLVSCDAENAVTGERVTCPRAL